VQPWTSC